MAGCSPMPRASMKNPRLLFCMLLLEIALLIFQNSVRQEVRKQKFLLAGASENLVVEKNACYRYNGSINLCGTEVARLESALPKKTVEARRAFLLTREKLKNFGIAGEVREKSNNGENVVLDVEGEGIYVDLAGFLCDLKKCDYTIRLNGLTVDALGEQEVRFTAEIEFALPPVSPGAERESGA